jgi:hypothetical protein
MIDTIRGFPTPYDGRKWMANPNPPQEVETFDQPRVKELGGIVQHILLASQAMVDLLQYDRELAREVGVESFCVEISGILEGDKFDRVVATVEEAVQKNTAVTISREGLARVRRLESLLAEAQRNISRFTPGGLLTTFTQERRAGVLQAPSELGQKWLPVLRNNLGVSDQAKPMDLLSMVVFGAIVVTLIVYAATTEK